MAVSHIKNVTIADFTGTVTVFNSAGATETANATDIVRPSDWNSAHNQFVTLTGNTNNASTVSGSNVVLSGGNGVTLIGSNSVIGFSVANQSVQTQNMVSILGSTGNISFANGNGITFGGNASTITASHNGLTSQSNQAVSGSNGSFTFQTITFGNLNGVSFYTSNGSMVASHNGLTTARASNDAVGLNTALTAGPLAWTVNSSGISLNAGSAAGTSTGFAGANISGSITHNTAGINLSLSVAAPGAAAENNNINLLGANTAGNTTASGSTIGLSGINMTLSGTNNSQVVLSVPATSSLVGTNGISISTNGSTISISQVAFTHSYFNPQDRYLQVAGQQGQGTLHIQPAQAPNVQFDRVVFPIVNTNSSNSSGSHTLSFWVGIYTRNASTLSLLSSTSSSTGVTHSGTAGSYSLYSGIRLFSIPWTMTLPESQYWVGLLSLTTSGGANGSYSQMLASQGASSFFGHFGSSVNSTMQYTRGLGTYSATTSAMPGSIAYSEIRGASNSLVLRQPIFYFVSGTV